MIKKVVRIILSFIGMTLGVGLYFALSTSLFDVLPVTKWAQVAIGAAMALVGAFIFYMAGPYFMRLGERITAKVEKELSHLGTADILLAAFGLILGLIIAYFISLLTNNIPGVGTGISALVYVMMAYLSIHLTVKRKEDLIQFVNRNQTQNNLPKEKMPWGGERKGKKGQILASPKLLDTSVIIDGRIADIAETGFIEGKLVVPGFVLEELRHIADSSDDLKRAKGRRGLDILNGIQSNPKLNIEMNTTDFPEIQEVDMKLLKLAEVMEAQVLTNDFNLNKVAQFQGVRVLNINELTNAVKSVLIPGEEMQAHIIKEGKEINQGIAYLEDGTMIVVEGGRKLIGADCAIVVTSVLQTAAGRMIFAKPKN